MQRKLVSVQAIGQLHPIPNADFIEKAIVQGWSGGVSEMLLDVPDVLLGWPSVEFNNTSRPLPSRCA